MGSFKKAPTSVILLPRMFLDAALEDFLVCPLGQVVRFPGRIKIVWLQESAAEVW